MAPRIAIPMPHSFDPEYAERAIPQYERALALAGGESVRVALNQAQDDVRKVMERCDGVLLPGSKADVDPARFNTMRSPHTATADPQRDAVDDLLLEDAYRLRKPVLGICYGLQSLNVYRGGSLVQHIPEFLPEQARARVDHEAGKTVAVAHTVEIVADSRLAKVVSGGSGSSSGAEALRDGGSDIAVLEALLHPEPLVIPVNSSHHQSADAIGNGLRIVARCPEDGIVEALEGTLPDHFVVAVQWHPERSIEQDGASRALFEAFIHAATRHDKL
jgi:putative glutamine amidotransferase